jgi:hypothetical protein
MLLVVNPEAKSSGDWHPSFHDLAAQSVYLFSLWAFTTILSALKFPQNREHDPIAIIWRHS